MHNNSHTSSLFHYTNNRKNLISILKEGLKYSYCKEEYFNKFVALPMVSFCDIPISRSGEHYSKYGIYALGLKKDFICRLMKSNFGPVIYLRENQISVLDQNNSDIYGFIKPYESDIIINSFGKPKKKHQIHYDECEWRAIIPQSTKINEKETCVWFDSQEQYDEWKKVNSKFLNVKPILFDAEDISFILVHKQNCISKTIKKIQQLTTIGGKKSTQEKKDILISKVLSFEQINSDL